MSSTDEVEATALVSRGPVSAGGWNLEKVTLRPLKEDEVLVRVVGSGICLGDLHVGDAAPGDDDSALDSVVYYPRVLGHEGSGFVERVGSAVKSVQPDDAVLMSFNSCGECYNCQDQQPAYCEQLVAINFGGEKQVYRGHDGGGDGQYNIGGCFNGQSSFGSRAIVKERSIVSLAAQNPSEDELRVFAPMGCGFQTGAGAVINAVSIRAGQDIAVLGVGSVGQSAIMAAATRQCKTIIAIDRSSSRLETARALGATHTIDTSDSNLDLVAEVKRMTDGKGVHASIDTTGSQPLARQSWDFVRNRGKVLQVGQAKPNDKWDVPMSDHMTTGKQIIGCLLGDAVPRDFIPQMIQWYRNGQFPLDKIVTQYPAADFQQALSDMRQGITIKPVLVWSGY